MIDTRSQIASHFPTVPLIEGATPIRRLSRLESLCGADRQNIAIYVKRDDLGEIGGGGNKLRKLELLLGKALADGADTVITIGGIQSNHARLTAAACARYGLTCELMLADMVPRHDVAYRNNGNVMLDDLFGAKVHRLAPNVDALAAAQDRAVALREQGRRAMVVPSGGSSPLGALGYVRCALEVIEQEAILGTTFERVVVPNGSSGTQAGLVAGFHLAGRGAQTVNAYSVLADRDVTHARTVQLAGETLALLGHSASALSADDVVIDGAHRGEAYGIPTPGMLEAVRLLARSEGLLLDPVYSGKAFAGLLADIRAGAVPAGTSVLYVMTGGTPGLFAYREAFAG
ncbi:D-cysteine desulfhydrase [Pandoraea iniqua]|uniref:D-cysteine desulfhydrase family protein n=1 Tax=Pandoraea iniqua TaxID=2508288 RepID=UPI001241C542|nr:D-cysteine desulfhydrase family protein [Pandoraea iniqua]VVE10061.1 D-cysteine desulfhydrase [Pandoraea iniqua]